MDISDVSNINDLLFDIITTISNDNDLLNLILTLSISYDMNVMEGNQ